MDRQQLVRQLPPVHELVRESAGEHGNYPQHLLTDAAREVLAAWRRAILEEGAEPPGIADLADAVRRIVLDKLRMSLRPVINATGVVLHTNLGRAPLSDDALAAATAVARGYSNLELDLETGGRGSRYSHVEDLLKDLTGAEAALVVNNNAAAVLLCLSALARGKEVVVSRGELVEIGGSFRIPEVMAQSGAILKEVGTTNKIYPRDYERAIGPETALLLKVHPSNYRILGFTREVTREELVSLGRKYQLPVMEDLGSGVLVDLQQYGVGVEPTVQASIDAGMDLVTFSGDKLLGGPQAGVILGRSGLLQVLKEHPLLRALRVDKLTLAALEATLRAYQRKDAAETLPVLRMLAIRREELQSRAEHLRDGIACRAGDACSVTVIDGFSRVGGGALPLTELPTSLVVLRPKKATAAALAGRLRKGDPPVLVRVQEDGVLLDPRTIGEGDEEALVDAVAAALRCLISEQTG
ncbi:MAG TPA: L-seryl-tRNA(Sec) selenium transferase [Syntrophomonadaceae bacterium]|nr:L-seryl-tRNA(Sec) selenium transferase [Syntrophomonadaceae bacterium]